MKEDINNLKVKDIADDLKCTIGEVSYWLYYLRQKGYLDKEFQLKNSYYDIFYLVRNAYENR